jgi:hypothetical protein
VPPAVDISRSPIHANPINSKRIVHVVLNKDELSIFENQLENIAKDERHQRQLAKIEKFQNQLEIQKNNINDLTHELKRDEKIIDKQFTKVANLSEAVHHSKEKELLGSFEQNFKELKEDFQSFLKDAK